MNVFDADIAYLVIIANAVLLAAAALAVLRFTRQSRALLDFWQSPTGAAVSEESNPAEHMQKLLRSVQTLEARVRELQEQVGEVAERPEPETRGNVRPLPIDNAARLARTGASVEELTRTCGLNIGEARLLQQLHAKRQTAECG